MDAAPVYALEYVRRGPQAILGVMLILVSGCGGWKGNVYRAGRVASDEPTFAFGQPPDDWRELRDVSGVQVAWVDPDIAGVIELRGQCAEQGDSSLQQYTDHLRIDWTNWEVLEQHHETLIGRDALRTVVDAELDGIPRRNEMIVVKKNGCLFDLRYSASPDTFAKGESAFASVVSGFRFPL